MEQLVSELLGGDDKASALARATQNAEAIQTLRHTLERPEATSPQLGAPQMMALSVVHQAPCTGYVSLWSGSGWQDKVDLRVGFSSPPTTLVGELNGNNDINSYIGTVVRPGEYWVAESERTSAQKETSVKCCFTPFA